MQNKEYLNEENYQKSKKKIIGIAIAIFIIGILIGGSLIGFGIVKSSEVKQGNNAADNVKAKENIQKQKDEINSELASLKTKQNQEFISNGLSEEYYRLSNEILQKEDQLSDLDSQIWKIESGYNSSTTTIKKAKYIPLYMFGAFIIISSGMISLFIYIFAKRREIMVFSTQQVMPVAQEGIDKMAPTVGNAAKELAKGIKEGINEADKEK